MPSGVPGPNFRRRSSPGFRESLVLYQDSGKQAEHDLQRSPVVLLDLLWSVQEHLRADPADLLRGFNLQLGEIPAVVGNRLEPKAVQCSSELPVPIGCEVGGGSRGRELLNREAITEAIRPFNPQGEFGARHLHTLPHRVIPPFDPMND